MKKVQAMLNFDICSVLQGNFIAAYWKFKLCHRNHVIYLHGIEIFKSVNKSLTNNESVSELSAYDMQMKKT